MLIRDPINSKTDIYRLSCLVRIFKCFKWDAFRIIFSMKNETLLELFNFYGSAHILHSHGGGRGVSKMLTHDYGVGVGELALR